MPQITPVPKERGGIKGRYSQTDGEDSGLEKRAKSWKTERGDFAKILVEKGER